MFELFWQADNLLARQGSAGLGLPQDKNFVKLNVGSMILDSALDNGNNVTCAVLIKHQAPQEVAA